MTSAHPNLDKRIFYKECVSLSKAGYETYIIAQGDTFEKQGVKIIGIPLVKRGRIERMIKAAYRVYKEAVKLNADVYHIHDPELLPYAGKLKKKGKVVIFDSHEDFFTIAEVSHYIPKIFRKLISIVIAKYLGRVCGKLDVIISVTPHICDKYRKYNKNTYMITNYPVITNEITDQSELSSDKAIVFAGIIGGSGNHEKIINAIEKMENVRYILCGPGEKTYMDKLKQLEGWKYVDYKGHVRYEVVKSILKKSRAGIHILKPNITTGYNIGSLGNTKIYEYMRAGLPVICTNFELWRNIINEYKCGICVNPQDEKNIYDAIKCLTNNYELACEMGKNAKRAVIEKYNWNTQEKVLLEIYSNMEKKISM